MLLKKQLIVVTSIIAITIILVAIFAGAETTAQSLSVSDAINKPHGNQKVQVSGNVVPDSCTTEVDGLRFKIYDPDGIETERLAVTYRGAASSTFGNDVTVICTGRIGQDGTLECSELLTKCPSKYEDSEDALTVSQLFDYGEEVVGKVAKVSGTVKTGTLRSVGSGERFAIVDPDDPAHTLSIIYDGALPDEIADGSMVVLTGALRTSGEFEAAEVTKEG